MAGVQRLMPSPTWTATEPPLAEIEPTASGP
jgi:hypothetical protein